MSKYSAAARFAYLWDLLSALVKREIQLRYRRSALGILWSLINPLLSLLIFVFLFQGVLKINVPHYPVYVFSGLLAWNWFSSSMTSSTFTLFTNRDLVRTPSFPIEVLILVNVSSNLVSYVLALPVLLGLILVSGVPLGITLLAFPLIVLVQFLLTAGLCFVVSVLNVYYRDIEHLVAVSIGIWFYLTPVFYKTGAVPAHYAIIFAVNPMAQLMNGYHAIFLTHQMPDTVSLFLLGAASSVAFAAGLMFFRHWKVDLVDAI